MSHKATNWLVDIEGLKAGEFQVLFHLCDCHNSANGCFPSQQYLRSKCNMSNGSINNHLNSLERSGHLRREKRFDKKTFQQKTTFYIFSFEQEFGKKPSPDIGVGAVSKKQAIPSPNLGQSRLHILETNQVIEPVSNDGDSAREEILLVSGHDRTGITATGRLVGGLEDMSEVQRWRSDLGLTQFEILAVIKDVMRRASITAPNSLKYFQRPMREYAAQKNKPPLTAIEGGRSNGSGCQTDEQLRDQIERAASGSFV